MELARLDEIEAQWAARLGCSSAELARPGTRLQSAESIPRERVRLLVRPGTRVVRCHPAVRGRVEAALRDHPESIPVSLEVLCRALGGEPGAPERVLYADAARFVPAPAGGLRSLSPDDADAFARLCGVCAPIEVERAEIELTQPLVVGLFEDGDLVAVSSYLLPGGPIADIGVLTHPARRGRGEGRRVASAVCEGILARGLIPQWWSLVSNRPSLGIATRLGFQPWAVEETVRLRA